MYIIANLPAHMRSLIFNFQASVVSPPLPPHTQTFENNPITVSKNLTKQTNSTEDKFQPRKVDNLRVAQWIFSTYHFLSNTSMTEYEMTLLLGHFSENITL